MLNIIIIGYNESVNLPRFFDSLNKIQDILSIRIIYIDQSSTDKSVDIATSYGAEIYIHPNQGYADPDKKRAVEELCKDDDWVLILDADEEITPQLAQEIDTVIQSEENEIGNILVRSIILGGFGGEAYQPRLFQKKAVKMTDEIHNYIHPISNKIHNLNNYIINDDLKYKGKEIQVFVEKLNRYSDKEIEKLQGLSKIKIIGNILWKPIQRFFGFGIIHKQFFRGIRGFILCSLMAYYQRSIYAKLYERDYL